MNELNNIDEAISSLPPCLFEIPDDKEYAKGLAGQIRAVPITQDTRKAIKALITEQVRLGRIDELEWLRSRYTALTWGHYDPFKKIDERLAQLKSTTLLEGDNDE